MTEPQPDTDPRLTCETWPYSQDYLLFLAHFLTPTPLAASGINWPAKLEADPLAVIETFLAQGLLRQTDAEQAHDAVVQGLDGHTVAQLAALLRARGARVLPFSTKRRLVRLLIQSDPDHHRRCVLAASHLQCTEPAVALVRRYLGQGFPEIERNSKLTRTQLLSGLQQIRDQAVKGLIGNAAWAALLAAIAAAAALLRKAQEAPFAPTQRRPFEPELIQIPAGPFLMGTGDDQVQDMIRRFAWAKAWRGEGWFGYEQPQHTVPLPTFEIGRYPVTNAEYARFVDATGHPPPPHWPQGRLPEYLAPRPVVRVSWHDAQAYAGWLRAQTGRDYCLPSEAEWEKAARGDDGWLWPWGNHWYPDRCNSLGRGSDSTTAVGQYSPQGDSPYGCADMAGNAWEWTRSLWGKGWSLPDFQYPYEPQDGREDVKAGEESYRVVRGGSFYLGEGGVRCASRFRDFPSSQSRFGGFRVAVVAADPGLEP